MLPFRRRWDSKAAPCRVFEVCIASPPIICAKQHRTMFHRSIVLGLLLFWSFFVLWFSFEFFCNSPMSTDSSSQILFEWRRNLAKSWPSIRQSRRQRGKGVRDLDMFQLVLVWLKRSDRLLNDLMSEHFNFFSWRHNLNFKVDFFTHLVEVENENRCFPKFWSLQMTSES